MIPNLFAIGYYKNELYKDDEDEYPLIGDRPIEKTHEIAISECELISNEIHICDYLCLMMDRSEISDIVQRWYDEYHWHNQIPRDEGIFDGWYIYTAIRYEDADSWENEDAYG